MTPALSTLHQGFFLKLGYLIYNYVELKQKFGKILYAPVDVYFEEK